MLGGLIVKKIEHFWIRRLEVCSINQFLRYEYIYLVILIHETKEAFLKMNEAGKKPTNPTETTVFVFKPQNAKQCINTKVFRPEFITDAWSPICVDVN